MGRHRGVHLGALGLAACLAVAALPAAADAPRRGGQIHRVEHARTSELPGLGPRHAPVTIEFFANLGDGYASGQLHGLLRELGRRHPQRLRVVYRLVASGTTANPHLVAALEAHAQGRFVAFVDELYKDTLRSPRVDALVDIARRAGLDADAVSRALGPDAPDREARAAQLRANHFARRRHALRRTPGLLINGVPFDRRPTGIDDLEEAYDDAYGQAMARLADGVALEALYDTLLAERARAMPTPSGGPIILDGVEPGDAPPGLEPTAVRIDRRLGQPLGPPPTTGAGAPVTEPVVVTLFCNLVTRPCGVAAGALDELVQAYQGEVRVVFRHLFDPADDDQEHAERYARAGHCAAATDRFDELHQQLLVRRGRPPVLEDAALAELVAERADELEAFLACHGDPATARAVAEARTAALAEGVSRTPSIVIDGRLYLGARSFDELVRLVERAREAGVLERLTGEIPGASGAPPTAGPSRL